LPDAPLPLPPAAPALGTKEEHQRAVQLLQRWTQAVTVYLQRQLSLVRTDLNWLVNQQPIRNLVPDSDITDPASFWVVDPAWVVTDAAGISGGRGFVLTGSPAGIHDAVSASVVVVPGTQYVLSGWIDARNLTSGTLSWVLIDALSSGVIAQANALAGTSSRTQVLVVIPGGTSLVKIVARADNAVVPSGTVIASEPQLELPIAGQIGVLRPEATLYRSNGGNGGGNPVPARSQITLGHPWVVHNPIVGQAGGFYTGLSGTQSAQIIGARFSVVAPTSATVTIYKNGVALVDYTSLVITTTNQSIAPAPVPLITNDKMTMFIEAINGNLGRIDLTLFELRQL